MRNRSGLQADQLCTWSDTHALPTAQTDFCRVASAPPTAIAPPATPRSSFAGLSHRALQAVRQAGMQMRPRSRSWTQVLPLEILDEVCAINHELLCRREAL